MTKYKKTERKTCPACDGNGKSYGINYCKHCKGNGWITEVTIIEKVEDEKNLQDEAIKQLPHVAIPGSSVRTMSGTREDLEKLKDD